MRHLFHPSLYQFNQPQPSYWEASAGDVSLVNKPLAGAQSCDVAIIGGGYTELSAAAPITWAIPRVRNKPSPV
jgi:hypothetical protein